MKIETRVFVDGVRIEPDKLRELSVESACIDRIINRINAEITDSQRKQNIIRIESSLSEAE